MSKTRKKKADPIQRVVRWPGLPPLGLTIRQLAAVRRLVRAWLFAPSPDVLADLEPVFAGSPAWGALVIPGRRRGTWRLPEPVTVINPNAENE